MEVVSSSIEARNECQYPQMVESGRYNRTKRSNKMRRRLVDRRAKVLSKHR
jgi:hypothetical protein